MTAKLVAVGRADWLNNSATKNQGIEPGPTANITTNAITRNILIYDTHFDCAWNKFKKKYVLKILSELKKINV